MEQKEKAWKGIGREFLKKGLPKIGGALIRAAGAAVSSTPVGGVLNEFGVFDTIADVVGGNAQDPKSIEETVKNMTEEELKSFAKLKELEAELEIFEIERLNVIDRELTNRHEIDANTSSWITKHVRPMTLMFLTVSYVLYLYLVSFILKGDDLEAAKALGQQISMLLGSVFAFYFGGRSFEKIKKVS
jgi:hypothetical protein